MLKKPIYSSHYKAKPLYWAIGPGVTHPLPGAHSRNQGSELTAFFLVQGLVFVVFLGGSGVLGFRGSGVKRVYLQPPNPDPKLEEKGLREETLKHLSIFRVPYYDCLGTRPQHARLL